MLQHTHPELAKAIKNIKENDLAHIRSELSILSRGMEELTRQVYLQRGALQWVFIPMAVAIIVAFLKIK